MPRGRQRIYTDIRGLASGRLVALDEVAPQYRVINDAGEGRAPDRRIRCSCACGKEAIVRLNDFLQGKSRSCGCAKGPRRLGNA